MRRGGEGAGRVVRLAARRRGIGRRARARQVAADRERAASRTDDDACQPVRRGEHIAGGNKHAQRQRNQRQRQQHPA